MVWFVQTLEKKGDDGDPAGIFHLTAKSDEGGGFWVGCQHEHRTHQEAADCPDAKKRIGEVTGFPTVDGTEEE